MKRTILICMMLLVSVLYSQAQEVKIPRKERRLLDNLSRETIQQFGAKEYYELCKDEKAIITLEKWETHDKRDIHNNGRLYYKVLYPNPDTLKPIRLEYDYTAFVRIWQDTKEVFSIMFGNGWGYPISEVLEDEKRGIKRQIMPFTPTDFGALEAQWKKLREKREKLMKKQLEEMEQAREKE